MLRDQIKNFLSLESSSAVILLVSALVALLICQTSLNHLYQSIWHITVLKHALIFYVNEGLMTLFFLLVGLELKREFLEGDLKNISQALLPGVAALGGMIVPALIYAACNYHDADMLKGWPIPVATDIAFALGVLSLFGKRVPLGLKLFLMALAIFDDLGAIFIIAFFQGHALHVVHLGLALLTCAALIFINYLKVASLFIYIFLGILCWVCLLNAGIHPTIAGVILAFAVPLNAKNSSLLEKLETHLHPWVAHLVMPIFAFANAGVSLQGVTFQSQNNSIIVGIFLGLLLGKQIGVLLSTWLVVQLKFAKLPKDSTWFEMYAVSILCGIGFTMSLFLGTLAFQENHPSYLIDLRIGVLLGSVLSGLVGAILLHIALQRKHLRGRKT